MSQQHQMAMQQMGGPVGGVVAPPANAGTPTNPSTFPFADPIKSLNTAIYDYLLCNEKYDAARAIKEHLSIETVDQVKQSPSQRGNQSNGVDMDVDSKDHVGVKNRPSDLPAPKPLSSEESPFLQDWWCQFWELYLGNRQRGKQTTISYVGQQRVSQKARTGMLAGMDPNAARGYNMMNNGQMNDLRQAAMKNGMNSQQQAQLANMKRIQGQAQGNMPGAQMERQGSQMDMNGPRSGSPNTGGDAPSPKRQRLDGSNMQQMNQAGRPGQPGQMQGGNQVGPPTPVPPHTLDLLRQKGLDPDSMSQEQLQRMSAQPTNIQAKSMEVYSAAIQQQMQAAMQRTNSNANKGMPPNAQMGPGGPQSSPMNQQGMDGNTGDFYGNRMGGMSQNGTAAAAAAGGPNNGNHALQDYQMQLMLLEQQNKKRLLMARQEQDSMAHPTGVPGPNGGGFAPGMSPSAGRAGDPSTNPNDMTRGTPNLKKSGMSPNGDMAGRGSPNPGMMDPNVNPAMRPQMMANGGHMIRPPSSHPMAGQMTPQQMEMMRNQNMMSGPNGWQGGPQPQMMPGQQPGPPGQHPNATPRQGNMPPPPAPGANPGGTQPSSPANPPAPPTPNQTNKAKPGNKKEAANKKNAANKKGAAAAGNEDSNAPPTPTPPPPMTPNNAASFQQNKNLQVPNGAPAPGQQPTQNMNNGQQPGAPPVQQQQVPDMGNAPFGAIGGDDQFGNMDFADLQSGDVLDNFDFDSFLNSNTGDDGIAFDATFAFGDGGEIDIGN